MNGEADRWANTALGHLNAGRFERAVAAFERLLQIDPQQGNHWYNLAFSLRRLRRFDEALDAYRNALDHGGDHPEEIHLNRAVIFAHDFTKPEAAKSELEAALAIAPDYFPALLNLGGIYEDLGDKEAAKATYEKARSVNPEDILTLTRIAVLSDVEDPDDPLIQRLQVLLDDPGVADGDKADIGFALGLVLDSAGSYDRAFAAYRAGNEATRADRGSSALYDPDREAVAIDRMIEAFSAPIEATPDQTGHTPIFICGMFRSGSTLAERILARHSRVTSGGELKLIPAMMTSDFGSSPEAVASADPGKIARLRQGYLEELAKLHPDADIVTDKQPVNFRHIGLIKRLFPDARIVDSLRNPRDNGLALYFAHLGTDAPYATDLDHIVHAYRDYRRLMAHWHALWPDGIHTLDYDALVADPEPHIRALVDFCGLEWEEACLEPHKADSAVRTASAWQVRQPVYKSSSGRWRNYERHIAPLIEAFAG